MRTITVLEHHHDSDKNPWRQFVSSEAEALEVALKGEWKPDAKRQGELLALSKEDLVQMVLEAEALR